MVNEKEVDPELVKRADYAYNPHPADAQAPALDAELVDRMIDAYWQDARPCESCKEGQATGMTAALRVAADALLGPVTDEEWFNQGTSRASLNAMIAARRSRLLAPAKSADERVTVCYRPDTHNGDPRPYKVLLDGKPAGECFGSHDPAQIYRLGLIATLKQEPRP